MELKLEPVAYLFFGGLGFNRTFMELKPPKIFAVCSMLISFNRTFMELKLDSRNDIKDSTKF